MSVTRAIRVHRLEVDPQGADPERHLEGDAVIWLLDEAQRPKRNSSSIERKPFGMPANNASSSLPSSTAPATALANTTSSTANATPNVAHTTVSGFHQVWTAAVGSMEQDLRTLVALLQKSSSGGGGESLMIVAAPIGVAVLVAIGIVVYRSRRKSKRDPLLNYSKKSRAHHDRHLKEQTKRGEHCHPNFGPSWSFSTGAAKRPKPGDIARSMSKMQDKRRRDDRQMLLQDAEEGTLPPIHGDHSRPPSILQREASRILDSSKNSTRGAAPGLTRAASRRIVDDPKDPLQALSRPEVQEKVLSKLHAVSRTFRAGIALVGWLSEVATAGLVTLDDLLTGLRRLEMDFIPIVSPSMQLHVGTRIWHHSSHAGTIQEVNYESGLPYSVVFDSGEHRDFAAASMRKHKLIPFDTEGVVIDGSSESSSETSISMHKLQQGDHLWSSAHGPGEITSLRMRRSKPAEIKLINVRFSMDHSRPEGEFLAAVIPDKFRLLHKVPPSEVWPRDEDVKRIFNQLLSAMPPDCTRVPVFDFLAVLSGHDAGVRSSAVMHDRSMQVEDGPHGALLYVHLLSGANLPKTDTAWGKIDPYIVPKFTNPEMNSVVSWAMGKARTRAIAQNYDPIWNELLICDTPIRMASTLDQVELGLQLWDVDDVDQIAACTQAIGAEITAWGSEITAMVGVTAQPTHHSAAESLKDDFVGTLRAVLPSKEVDPMAVKECKSYAVELNPEFAPRKGHDPTVHYGLILRRSCMPLCADLKVLAAKGLDGLPLGWCAKPTFPKPTLEDADPTMEVALPEWNLKIRMVWRYKMLTADISIIYKQPQEGVSICLELDDGHHGYDVETRVENGVTTSTITTSLTTPWDSIVLTKYKTKVASHTTLQKLIDSRIASPGPDEREGALLCVGTETQSSRTVHVICNEIQECLTEGAGLYNLGNTQGCIELYQSLTERLVVELAQSSDEANNELRQSLQNSQIAAVKRSRTDKRGVDKQAVEALAWDLRKGFTDALRVYRGFDGTQVTIEKAQRFKNVLIDTGLKDIHFWDQLTYNGIAVPFLLRQPCDPKLQEAVLSPLRAAAENREADVEVRLNLRLPAAANGAQPGWLRKVFAQDVELAENVRIKERLVLLDIPHARRNHVMIECIEARTVSRVSFGDLLPVPPMPQHRVQISAYR